MKKFVKEQKGITLIALIITIIVMLILVAVTINVALNGGLFGKANKSAKDTEMQSVYEQTVAAMVLDDNGDFNVNATGEAGRNHFIATLDSNATWTYDKGTNSGTLTVHGKRGTYEIEISAAGIGQPTIKAGGSSPSKDKDIDLIRATFMRVDFNSVYKEYEDGSFGIEKDGIKMLGVDIDLGKGENFGVLSYNGNNYEIGYTENENGDYIIDYIEEYVEKNEVSYNITFNTSMDLESIFPDDEYVLVMEGAEGKMYFITGASNYFLVQDDVGENNGKHYTKNYRYKSKDGWTYEYMWVAIDENDPDGKDGTIEESTISGGPTFKIEKIYSREDANSLLKEYEMTKATYITESQLSQICTKTQV